MENELGTLWEVASGKRWFVTPAVRHAVRTLLERHYQVLEANGEQARLLSSLSGKVADVGERVADAAAAMREMTRKTMEVVKNERL